MGLTVAQTYLSDILHVLSQGLLIPTIAILLALVAYALFCIGSVVAEYFTERRHFNVTMPKFLAALMAAKQDDLPQVVESSGLLRRQKEALLTVYQYRTLPGDALVALIRRLVDEEESRYDRIAARNNMAARVSPMIGLMGTLIPLGPGIEALGRADTSALSSSLLIAFDTTVAGLVVAAVCLIVGKIRSNWYGNYMSALDSAMATMLEKIGALREEGAIATEEPDDYEFLFGTKQGGRGEAGGERRSIGRPRKEAAPASAEPRTDYKPTKATQSISQTIAAQKHDAQPGEAPLAEGRAPRAAASGVSWPAPSAAADMRLESAPQQGAAPARQGEAAPATARPAAQPAPAAAPSFEPANAANAENSANAAAAMQQVVAPVAAAQEAATASAQAAATVPARAQAAVPAADAAQAVRPVNIDLQGAVTVQAAPASAPEPVAETEAKSASRPGASGGWYQPRLRQTGEDQQVNPYSDLSARYARHVAGADRDDQTR